MRPLRAATFIKKNHAAMIDWLEEPLTALRAKFGTIRASRAA
ncbi:MAG: hypothetical protein Q8M24_18235 [Pseudolabrys sp.]|nr:hypothetical protein [Pseudolabrys sp.]MDP2297386.1 hypothetical protein [Pseudolabrys sp.]